MESLQLSALDLRLALMAAVLAAMAVVFHVLTGNFLTPENLYNIAQQTAVVGIVATAIALVVVGRHIDLSVGSVMGFVGVLIAWLQYTHGWSWMAACGVGLLAAIAVGLYQGGLTAYLGVPSFVVTLGGLMSFRGAAFLVAHMDVLQPVEVVPAHDLHVLLQEGRDPGVIRHQVHIVAIADVLTDLLLAGAVESRGTLQELVDIILGLAALRRGRFCPDWFSHDALL